MGGKFSNIILCITAVLSRLYQEGAWMGLWSFLVLCARLGMAAAHTDGFSWLPPAKHLSATFTHICQVWLYSTPSPTPTPVLSLRQPEGSVAGSTHTCCVQAMLQEANTMMPKPCTPVGTAKHESVAVQLHTGHRDMFYSHGIMWTKQGPFLQQTFLLPLLSVGISYICYIAICLWAVSYSCILPSAGSPALPLFTFSTLLSPSFLCPPCTYRQAHLFLSFGSVSYSYGI